MVCIYKNLHARNGHQAGARLFARSISIRRTSEARFIYIRKRIIFLWELCNVALLNAMGTFHSNLLEHIASYGFYFAE